MERKKGKNTATRQTSARKAFSTVGLGCFSIIVVTSLLRMVLRRLFPEWITTSWGLWIYTFVPIYAIGVPLSLLIFRMVPARGGAYDGKNKIRLTPGQLVRAVFIAFFLLKAGSLVSTLFVSLFSTLTGVSFGSALTTYTMSDSILLKVLFMAILGPLVEELVFRKLVIDRTSCYGEKLAVVTSALMFGLFHGNFTQFFYSFAMGLLLGYIYLKTGRLRYSAGLHILINFTGVVEAVVLTDASFLTADIDAMSTGQLAVYLVWVFAELAAVIVGLILFCRARRNVSYEPASRELPKGSVLRNVYGNIGMILFILGCAELFVKSIL